MMAAVLLLMGWESGGELVGCLFSNSTYVSGQGRSPIDLCMEIGLRCACLLSTRDGSSIGDKWGVSLCKLQHKRIFSVNIP